MDSIGLRVFSNLTGISKVTIERLRGERSKSDSTYIQEDYLSKSFDPKNPKLKVLTYEDRLKMFIYECFYRENKKTNIYEIIKTSLEFIEENDGRLEESVKNILKIGTKKQLSEKLKDIESMFTDHFKIKRRGKDNVEKILKKVPESETIKDKQEEKIEEKDKGLNLKENNLRTLGKIFYQHCRREKGFLSIQHPTGNGKTYQLEELCAYILKNELEENKEQKIIILANNKLNRNAILKGIGEKIKDQKELLGNEVFLLQSVEDILRDKNFFSEVINSLKKDREFFSRYEKREEVLKKIKNSFENYENIQLPNTYELLKEEIATLKSYLIKYFKEDEEERPKIKLPQFYYKLYPMIDEKNRNKKIFIMTIDKFLYGYFSGIKNEYFYEDEKNLIIIDEVDSAKEIFLNFIKKNRSKKYENVIEEFNSRLNNLIENENNLISVLINSFEKNNIYSMEDIKWIENLLEDYRKEGAALREKYETTSKYFQLLEWENIDLFQRKNHFFEKTGKKLYVSQIDDHWGIGIKKTKNSFEFSILIKELQFFSQDKLFYVIKNLVERMNKEILVSEEIKSSEIIQHIFQNIEMRKKISKEYQDFFSFQVKKENCRDKSTSDVYFQECRYINIHRANPYWNFNNRCEVDIYQMSETPESLLLKIAEKNMVFGISATARSESLLGNFDQGWLRKKLEKDFLTLTGEERHTMRDELEITNNYEKNMERELNIYKPSEYDELENLKGFKNIKEKISEVRYERIIRKIENILNKFPEQNESGAHGKESLIYAFFTFLNFFLDDRTKSLLFLSNRLNGVEEVIEELAEAAAKEAKSKHYIRVYDSKKLEKDLLQHDSELLTELEKGEKKVIIYTALQSAGKGVNIKFKIGESIDLKNLVMIDTEINKNFGFPTNSKDIDEIALEGKTHLSTIEKTVSEEKLTQLYWLNILEENGIIDEKTRHNIINSTDKYSLTSSYKKSEDYIENSLSWIIQGLGRVNRTKVKGKKRNIYLNHEAAKSIAEFRVNGREMVEDFYFIKEKIERDPSYLINKRYEDLAEKCEKKNTDIQNNFRERYLEKIQKLNRIIRESSSKNLEQKESLIRLARQYENLRNYILKNPTVGDTTIDEFYLKFHEIIESYSYEKGSSGEIIGISTNGERGVSKKECKLDLLLQIDELKEFLEGRVGDFEKNHHIILPYVYQAIFKGKLGEVIIKELLDRHGVQFMSDEERVELGMVEIFDDILPNGAYIDYKNFNLENWRMRKVIEEEINYKMEFKSKFISEEKKLFLINLIAPKEEKNSERIAFYRIDREKSDEEKIIQVKSYDESEVIVIAGVIKYQKNEFDKTKEILTVDYDILKKLSYMLKNKGSE